MRATVVGCLPVFLLATACSSSASQPIEPAPPSRTIAPPENAELESDAPAESTECPNEAGLCFSVTPADAQLEVDGNVLGPLGDLGNGLVFVGLEPGIHMITLTRDGYATWRAEVSIAEAAETINLTMEAKHE